MRWKSSNRSAKKNEKIRKTRLETGNSLKNQSELGWVLVKSLILLYHRELRRLVVIELKLGKFMPADFGQTEFYLRWLDKYERKPWEESPIGLILCSEKSNERVELLALDKHDIKVADYWTQLPDKKLLEQKLHEAVILARELSERK